MKINFHLGKPKKLGKKDNHASKALVCVDDYEQEAKRRLSKQALGYYASGADSQFTLRDNQLAFLRYRILPRILRDVSILNTSTELLGRRVDFPICISPSAMHKLAHKDGELATARAASESNTLMVLSTLSTVKLEEVSAVASDSWFQLYLFKDRSKSLELIRRAEQAQYRALVLTVDAPVFGLRRADARNNFVIPENFLANFTQEGAQQLTNLDYIDASLKWSDIEWLQSITKLPIVLKGVLSVADCLQAAALNVKAIVVSNHGGRQLDSAPATIDVLSNIVKAVGNRIEVYVDGGIRSGADVFKCLALGAKAVFIGRPVLWGLAVNGSDGVSAVLTILRKELETTMRLAGCTSLSELSAEYVAHQSQIHS